MEDNRNLQKPVYIQKADMALADLVSGGKLNADQWKRFYLIAIKGQVVMSRVRTVRLTRETTEIPKMSTFGSQVLHPATESQALTLAQRVKPGFDKVTLVSTEVMAQMDYPRFALMDQVEGPRFKSTLVAYLSMHIKSDFEKLICIGEVGSTNTLLNLYDGMIVAATSNVYQAGSTTFSSTVMDYTKRTMPSEFRKQQNMMYLTNEYAADDYQAELEARGTGLGDSKIWQGGDNQFRGKPVVSVPEFPDDEGGTNDETVCMYGNPKNFLFGLHETLEMESEYNIRERTWTVVFTCRIAEGYEHEPATVKATEITGQ
jgi:hypothetical protein